MSNELQWDALSRYDPGIERLKTLTEPLAPSVTKPTDSHLQEFASVIENVIVPRLLISHVSANSEIKTSAGNASEKITLRQVAVNDFVAQTMIDDPDAAVDYVRHLLTSGVTFQDVLLDLLAPAARILGERWEQDSASFVEVALGMARMHRILREFDGVPAHLWSTAGDGRHVLLLPTPGEQHTFGLRLVQEFLLRESWTVTNHYADDLEELSKVLRSDHFDVVGISLSGETLIQPFLSAIQVVRKKSKNPRVKIIVGGHLFAERTELIESCGADGYAADAPRQLSLSTVGPVSWLPRHERETALVTSMGIAKPIAREASFAQQDPAVVAAILSKAVDVTVMMTSDGVVCDQVLAGPDLPRNLFAGWPGKPLSDTVTVESKIKIEQLLGEAGNSHLPRWRQVSHPTSDGRDLPVSYSAIKAGPKGHIIAIGRDMSKVAVLQQRLLSAEQAIEQEYQRLRNAETRFRVLLQSATDAIMIVEARTGRIVECNPAAATLLGRPFRRLQNSQIDDVFSDADRGAIKTAMDALRTVGRTEEIVLHSSESQQQAIMSFSMFRQENATYFLMRMVPHAVGESAVVLPRAQSKVVKLISEMPDGFVVTDQDLKILTANAAFLELAQLASEEQARGLSLDRWLGRQGGDINLMVGQLIEKGEIRNHQTIVRGQFGTKEDVEVSAVAATDGDTPCFGFSLHHFSRQRASAGKQDQGLLRSVEEFTRLVGKVPLKELVRESTDIIERLCIEAALQMNGDNRAGAAEMLGLSRQSLYVKLHRYGIDAPELGD